MVHYTTPKYQHHGEVASLPGSRGIGIRDFSVSSANLSSVTGVSGAWNAGRDMFTEEWGSQEDGQEPCNYPASHVTNS